MAKAKVIYSCSKCGAQSPKWLGRCLECGAWDTMQEEMQLTKPTTQNHRANATVAFSGLTAQNKIQKLSEVETEEIPRVPTGNIELDRVLGGGLVNGGVILIGGDPGIGKSTLLLQTLAFLSESHKVLYVSGEESAQQIALRARRLGIVGENLPVLIEIQLEKILESCANQRPEFMVIDSIQTIYTEILPSAPGSVGQVRECAAQLTRLAKTTGITMVLIGHVTKEGTLAGPRVLEHIVDTVLYFGGDTQSSFRLVRAFKNRFGAVNELGVFAMTDKGLKSVVNPSALFLSHHDQAVSGSCVTVTQEGSRPMLVEIQALVTETQSPNPRRLTVGLEQNRLAMLLAVLARHGGIFCFSQDVFINAVSGVKITEPSADLAVLLAMISSFKNISMPEKLVIFGEIGLAGEIRPVQRGIERLREASKLGFTHALIPKGNFPKNMTSDLKDMTITPVGRVEEAISQFF